MGTAHLSIGCEGIILVKFTCNVKQYRVAKKLTQAELSDFTGVRRETIGRLENAQYVPSLELGFKIAWVLNTPITDLFKFNFSDDS
uniref:Conserved domain protein n=1 Tax=Lactiplantibacillus plantarum TaxID=1590 RepID=D3K3V6_LACPN|nr:helix-turn-helix transcriptional regulator [Lactiplantibacillus plantarum]ADC30142.1 conserved domain protein [Lactiplantibacillus plantarum]